MCRRAKQRHRRLRLRFVNGVMIIQEKIRAEFVVIDHSSKTVHMFNCLSMINPSDLATFSIVNKSIAGHTKALSINFWFSQNQRCKHSFLHTKLIFIGDGVIHPLKTELALQPLSMSLTRDLPSLNRSKNVKDIFNFTISLTLRNNDHDNDNNHTSKAQLTITLEWLIEWVT